jgi:hypothetical protein
MVFLRPHLDEKGHKRRGEKKGTSEPPLYTCDRNQYIIFFGCVSPRPPAEKKTHMSLASRIRPLLELWERSPDYELEALLVVLDKKQHLPHHPSSNGVPIDVLARLISHELSSQVPYRVRLELTRDSFAGAIRYSHDPDTGSLLSVIEKRLIKRVEVPFPELGIGVKINLKRERDVQHLAPAFEKALVTRVRVKERTCFQGAKEERDFTIVQDGKTKTCEVEIECRRGTGVTSQTFAESILQCAKQASLFMKSSPAARTPRTSPPASTSSSKKRKEPDRTSAGGIESLQPLKMVRQKA